MSRDVFVMKRGLIIGLVLGLALSIPITAFGSEVISMLGKQVDGQFNLKIDGKYTEKPVVVIEGTSYLPVRAAGELFGYNVSFIDEEVILEKATVTNAVYELQTAISERTSEIHLEIFQWESKITEAKEKLEKFKNNNPVAFENSDLKRVVEEAIADYEAEISKLQAELAELQPTVTPTEPVISEPTTETP